MDSTKKKEFQLRIANGNSTELTIILFEMIETYIMDAKSAFESKEIKDFEKNLSLARDCIQEMCNNLHFEYELAKTLKQLYVYLKKLLMEAKYDKTVDKLPEALKIIKGLHDSFVQVKDVDKSAPLMHNTQALLTGMTYGSNRALEVLAQDCSSRGVLV